MDSESAERGSKMPLVLELALARPFRPSSAGGKLQTHATYYTGLLEERRAAAGLSELPQIERKQRPLTAQQLRMKEQGLARSSPRLEEKQRVRRPTISTVEDAKKMLDLQKSFKVHRWLGDSEKGKIEEKIDLSALDSLKKAFHAADTSGDGTLDVEEFKQLLKKKLKLPASQLAQVMTLFDKIDWSSEGAINWDEFCTYMQVEFAEKEDSQLRRKEVAFNLPALSDMTPHRSDVVRIASMSDGSFVVLSVDGFFSFWSSACKLKKTRSIITSDQNQRTNSKWITDFVVMTEFNKLVVTTGDRELEFFEQSSFEPYCCVCGLETIPLRLTYHVPKQNTDESLLIFGDRQGCINILMLHSTGESLRTWKKYPKSEGIPTVSMDVVINSSNVEFVRWKVHNEWINELKFEPSTGQTISCSNEEETAVVIGSIRGSTNVDASLKEVNLIHGGLASGRASRATSVSGIAVSGSSRPSELAGLGNIFAGNVLQVPANSNINANANSFPHHAASGGNAQPINLNYTNAKARSDADQLVFKIYKGARTFAFSDARNIMVTGGMDRIIRCWNPYVPSKPTGFLRGHTTPIVYLAIDETENRLFSMSTDKCVKVWDLLDLGCLLTIRPKAHQVRGDLQCCYMSMESRTFCLATDQMSMLNLKLRPMLRTEVVLSHKESVTTCRYNPLRKHVVSCSEGSIIKVWDIESGTQVFEYGEAHGDAAVTCACFDLTGRRLITGGRDGNLRMWNYINGHCLQTLCKEKHNAELSGVTYVEMNKNRYIIAVGWDKAINLYNDNVTESICQINRPLPRWTDDEIHGHKEDILAVTDCPPNFLATSSYDGQVIVWNMISGYVMVNLSARPPPNYTDDAIDGDLSISKLCFIRSRIHHRTDGVLIASGPRAHIHIWSIFQGGKLMAQFQPAADRQAQITGLAVGEDEERKNTLLVSGDQLGYINVWNISEYARSDVETDAPPLIASWRGHTEMVTGLEYSAAHRTVVSSSTDCTVRLWTFEGHYIGTFGQPVNWNIYDASTYQHPMVPYDILIDPKSLPKNLVPEGSLEEPKARTKVVKGVDSQVPLITSTLQQTFFVDDATIADQIRKKLHRQGDGKRLRHEILKPSLMDHGGPNNFQRLVCFELDSPKKVGEPSVVSARKTKSSIFD